jgi:regulatory protein
LKKTTNPEQALIKLAKLCSQQELCLSDASKKLTSWGIDEDQHDSILNKLIDENYINEQRYAEYAVNDKWKLNGWGRLKIVQFLENKNILSEIINKAIQGIDEAEYKNRLKTEILKKLKTLASQNNQAIMAMLMRFAASRGFEEEIIQICIDEIIKK